MVSTGDGGPGVNQEIERPDSQGGKILDLPMGQEVGESLIVGAVNVPVAGQLTLMIPDAVDSTSGNDDHDVQGAVTEVAASPVCPAGPTAPLLLPVLHEESLLLLPSSVQQLTPCIEARGDSTNRVVDLDDLQLLSEEVSAATAEDDVVCVSDIEVNITDIHQHQKQLDVHSAVEAGVPLLGWDGHEGVGQQRQVALSDDTGQEKTQPSPCDVEHEGGFDCAIRKDANGVAASKSSVLGSVKAFVNWLMSQVK